MGRSDLGSGLAHFSTMSTVPPPPKPDAPTGRSWWKKKRFIVPTAAVAGLFAIGVAASPADEDTASDSTSTTTAIATTSTAATSSTAASEPALDAQPSALDFPVSQQMLTITFDALDDATVVNELVAPVPYRRAEYSDGWGDADNDCMSDRHEILLDRTEVPAEVVDCNVATGQWTDPYDGTVYVNARLVTIDHFVPLSAAHRAGAWAWDSDTKQAFAADITYRPTHVPAGQETNEDKADQEPHLWRPDRESWCGYAINWVGVKTRWQLAYSTDEVAALTEMLESCEVADINGPATTIPSASPTTSTTTTSSTTTIQTEAGAAMIEVSSCDARGETVELINTGGESITLNGWVLHDEGRNHETALNQVTLEPGGAIVMLSGADSLDTEVTMRWKDQNVWNNDGDEAFLLDASGDVVSRRRCSN